MRAPMEVVNDDVVFLDRQAGPCLGMFVCWRKETAFWLMTRRHRHRPDAAEEDDDAKAAAGLVGVRPGKQRVDVHEKLQRKCELFGGREE